MPRSAQPAELLRKTILLFERCSRQQERVQLSRQRNCSTALCVFCRDGGKNALFPDLTLQIGDLACGLLLPMAAKRIQDRLSVVLAGADDRTGVAIHRSAQRGNALLRIAATTVDRLCKFELAVQDRSVQTVEAVLQIGVDPGEALAQRLLDTGKSCGHVVLDLTERIVLSRLRLSDIIQTCASFRRIFCSGNAQIGCNRADTVAIAESVAPPATTTEPAPTATPSIPPVSSGSAIPSVTQDTQNAEQRIQKLQEELRAARLEAANQGTFNFQPLHL